MTFSENTKKILLSFDLEEFDIPLEYGQEVDPETQFQVTLEGLHRVLELLDELQIRATFFTTAVFALKFPEVVKTISEKHEIASHGFEHSKFSEEHLKNSKTILESVTGKEVVGFRRSRLGKTDSQALLKAGYIYDSSLNPIYLPGRYNNFNMPRKIYNSQGLVEIPISATPIVRFPLFWLTYKNFQISFVKAAAWWTLKTDGYLNIFFHPWEFADLSKYFLPIYVKWCDGAKMQARLKKHLIWLKKCGTFVTMGEFVEQWQQSNPS